MTLRDKLKFWLALNNYIEMIVHDTSLLSLPNAMEDSLDYLKALGGTEITPKVYFDSITANGGCEQRNLPSEYTQLEYVWMKEDSYLLTDIIPTYDGRYELDMQTLSLKNNPQTYLGARDDSTSTSGLRFAHITNKTCRVYGLSDTYITSSDSMTNNTHYKFVYDNKSITVSAGNTVLLTGTFESDQVITTPLAINGWNTNGTIAVNAEGMYVYSFRAFNAQGELIADYVPAIQKGTASVIGFYDTVSKTFKTATAGTFTAGPDAVPSPDTPMDIYCNNGALKVNTNLYWTEYSGYQLSQTDGITVTTNSGVNVSGMIDCRTIKSFKITTISPQGAFRIFKYKADNTFINAAVTANIGDIITFEDEVGFFRIQYNYTNIGVNTENILIYNSVYDLNEIYIDHIEVHGKNLFDSSAFNTYVGDTITYTYHQIPNGTYTMSTNFPPQTGQIYTNVWVMSGIQTSGQSSETNGVSLGNPKTITVTDGWYTVAYRSSIPAIPQDPKDYNWQLEKGSTATDYEPYSTKHKVETINVHGKNFFDAQWQQGIYNTSTGTHTPNVNNRICNVNMIQVKPSTTYTVSCPDYALASGMRWLFYDANQNFISANTTGATTITTPANAKYINFYIANNLTVDTAPDLQIEQSSTTTTYELYFDGGSATTEMLLSVEDYKDTQEVLSGNVTRNIGIKVLDGTEDWSVSISGQMHYAYMTLDGINANIGETTPGILCSHYIPTLKNTVGANNTIGVRLNKNGFIITDNPHANSVDNWKQFLADQYAAGNPVIIIYPLAIPTIETVSSQPLTYVDNYVLTIEDASISNPIVNATNSTHTIPTPDKPLDITCNNGVLKASRNLLNDTNVVNAYNATGNYIYKGFFVNNIALYSSNANYRVAHCVLPAGSYRFETDTANAYILRYAIGSTVTELFSDNQKQYMEFTLTTTTEFSICWRNSTTTEFTGEHSWISNGTTTYHPYGQIYADDMVETINVHGKNLFDVNNVTIQADTSIGADGSLVTSIATKVCITYIPVKPNTTYTISGDILGSDTVFFRLAQYKSDKTFLGRSADSTGQRSSYTFTTGADTYFVRFHCLTRADLNTYQLERGSTATAYEPYFDNGTATAEMLLKVGDYQDVQNILDGAITRKVGVKVFDGTENWNTNAFTDVFSLQDSSWIPSDGSPLYCSHFNNIVLPITTQREGNSWFNLGRFNIGWASMVAQGTTAFKQWLAEQYANGTPVMIVYPLATPTTESVTGQLMQVVEGNNIAEITQASLDNLELEAKYNSVP